MNGKSITAVIDTGAQLSLMALEDAERLGVKWERLKEQKKVTEVGRERWM